MHGLYQYEIQFSFNLCGLPCLVLPPKLLPFLGNKRERENAFNFKFPISTISTQGGLRLQNSGVSATNHQRPAFAVHHHHTGNTASMLNTAALLRNYRAASTEMEETQLFRRIEFNED